MSTSAISKLSREIANSSVDDREQQSRLFKELVRAAAKAHDADQPALEFLLDTAADLLRYVADGSQPSPEALLTMVTRVVVNAECGMHRSALAAGRPALSESDHEPSTTSPKEPSKRPLKLVPPPEESLAQKDLNRVRLGQLLVQLGLAESEQIQDALSMQQEEGLRIGEALARLGHLDPHDLRDALGLQNKMRQYANTQAGGQGPDPNSVKFVEWHESILGEVLLSSGAISKSELDAALAVQRATGMRIGEILVHKGMCDWSTVRSAIRLQEKLRHGGRIADRKLS